jgi:diguanylate cyclase (GGDEF)-like protein
MVTGAVVTFIDITERRKAEETIRHMATHDGLTNLPSLLLCRDRLAMAISQANRDGKKAAVLFIDLDGFKAVNDTHGHDAGDVVLKETARRLCASVRETDTVARIGGDEFLAVIVDLKDASNAELIAKKILASIAKPFIAGHASVHVGASVGIALFPRKKTDDVEELIKLADQAMYRVKKSGKNGFRFAGDDETPLNTPVDGREGHEP